MLAFQCLFSQLLFTFLTGSFIRNPIITSTKEESAPGFTFGYTIIKYLISQMSTTIRIRARGKLAFFSFSRAFLDDGFTSFHVL